MSDDQATRAERVISNPRVRQRLQEVIDNYNENYDTIETVPFGEFERRRTATGAEPSPNIPAWPS